MVMACSQVTIAAAQRHRVRLERRQVTAPQIGAAEVRLGRPRAGQVDRAERGTGATGAGEVGLAHAQIGERGPAQVSAWEPHERPVAAGRLEQVE